jgi:HD-GYP domain-containing protein (c-di-GMP phosphodiesterase class II)
MADSDRTELDRSAKDIVNQLAAIIRTSQIHDPSNVAVMQGIEKFITLVNALLDSPAAAEGISLEMVGEYFYLNESRVKFSMEYLVNFDFLMREFRKHDLGSVSFLGTLSKEDIQRFLKAFLSASFSSDPYVGLAEGLDDIPGIRIAPPRKIQTRDNEYDIRRTVKHTYFNAVSFTKGVMTKIQSGEKINVRRAKRVVQSMVDLLLSEEELVLGMSAIKDYDDYTYHHCVNVSILSMALGQKLGFSKQSLLELGMVALFHDIGKTDVPPEVLNKPGSFTEEEWKIVRKHPFWGVRAILKMKGFDMVSVRSAIAAFEHHIRYDKGGYPERRHPEEVDLYSRIVSLADQYDGMTSARVYSRTPMAPDKALSVMMERAGSSLDPLLFKFFINMVGLYPVGTAVLLNTRQLALVYGNNPTFPDRPKVMVVTDAEGNKASGALVDLTEKDQAGAYQRSIMKTMDPGKYKINLAEYLL